MTTPEAAPRYREALESLPAVRRLPRMRVRDRDGKVLIFPRAMLLPG